MHYPGVKYIAGRNFQSEHGEHTAGEVVDVAPQFPNLEVLVSAGYLYPYAPEAGYEYLPPHLFSSADRKEEVLAKIRGDQHAAAGTVQYPGGKPEVVQTAERDAEIQSGVYGEIARQAERNKAEALTRESTRQDDETLEQTQARRSRRPLDEQTAQPAAKKAAATPAKK